jgi:hypothetical protein
VAGVYNTSWVIRIMEVCLERVEQTKDTIIGQRTTSLSKILASYNKGNKQLFSPAVIAEPTVAYQQKVSSDLGTNSPRPSPPEITLVRHVLSTHLWPSPLPLSSPVSLVAASPSRLSSY